MDKCVRIEAELFAVQWRIAREHLFEQRGTLRTLFDAAKAAADEKPKEHPAGFRLDELSEEDVGALMDFMDKERRCTGARDAYATALLLFVDTLLKSLRMFYDRIPEATRAFDIGIAGIDLHKIVRYAGNNVRHYLEWRVPFGQLEKPHSALAAAKVIAALMKRKEPALEEVSLYASNWAWQILMTISNGSFDGLLAILRDSMDEMLRNSGMEQNVYVIADREKYPL